MAKRRKGVSSKAKTSANKLPLEATIQTTNAANKLKDDPGGGPPAMELLHNTKTQLTTKLLVKNQEKDDQQKTNQLQPNQSTTYNNNSANFSDLKYLHKKFKRIASATTDQVIGNNNLSSSSSSSTIIHHQQPQLNGILTSDLNDSVPKIEQQQQQQHHINDLINRTTSPSSNSLLNNSKITTTNHFDYNSSHSHDDKNDFLLLQQTSHKLSLPPLPNNLTLSSNSSPTNFIENNFKIVNNHHNHINKSASFNNNNNSCVTINSTTNPSANNIISANTIYVSSSNGGTNFYNTANLIANSTLNGQTVATTTLSCSGSSQKAIPTIAQEQTSTSGRHVCPYCQLNCSKPSVLQKHIRAHTNERPYPCHPCGFAFKTKSNLYKHERSRAHLLRTTQSGELFQDDETSLGSEQDLDQEMSSNASGSEVACRISSPLDDRECSPGQPPEKPYKPKFHNAALYAKDESKMFLVSSPSASANFSGNHPLANQNLEFVKQHISKIISENEAIMEVVEPALQKKYHKITGISRGLLIGDNSSPKLALALLKQQQELINSVPNKMNQQQQSPSTSSQQPLNLTKGNEVMERKRGFSEGLSGQDVANHPQNPERSIIKDLLLNSRGFGAVQASSVDTEKLLSCPFCNIAFRNPDVLKYHTICYCKGNQGNGPVTEPDPTSLAKLASTSLRKQPYKGPTTLVNLAAGSQIKPVKQKPENIVINPIVETSSQQMVIQLPRSTDFIQAPLPSPGPLLGKTRLVETYDDETYGKRPRPNYHHFQMPIMEEMSPRNLQFVGGEARIVDKIEDKMMRYNSGGSITSMSPNPHNDMMGSPSFARGMSSGGRVIQLCTTTSNEQPLMTPKLSMSITPNLTPTLTTGISSLTHFQFPPINAITGYNPLTLPPIQQQSPGIPTSILHGGRVIPHVPGMPGPDTSLAPPKANSPSKMVVSPIRRNVPSPLSIQSITSFSGRSTMPAPSFNCTPARLTPRIKIENEEKFKKNPFKNGIKEIWSPIQEQKKSFNFTRIADNLSPTRLQIKEPIKSPDAEIRYFNFENLISKSEILIKPPKKISPLMIEIQDSNTQIKRTELESPSTTKVKKFLRPNSLPLKPGTFIPKRHHGITPTQNTLPLISPETPRPSRACVQLYLNGHAYTYLGLKCSTKSTYCTVSKTQPKHFANEHKLSMYSNWQTCDESNPHPMGLSSTKAMSMYDSRQRHHNFAISQIGSKDILVHSQSTIMTPFENDKEHYNHHQQPIQPIIDDNNRSTSPAGSNILASIPGGYESNEDYTYVRGRGRGRYVCSECGIRCKKPSMLKKHIRTHTDVRPYTCLHCSFSFKTKGNLTKHMKSKAHYKKCVELGLNPVPITLDDDAEMDGDQNSMAGGGSTIPGDDSDSYSDSDGDDGDSDSDTDESKSRLIEHEAARCLISLSMTPPIPSPTLVPTSSTNRLISYPAESYQIESDNRRIVTTFTAPITEFDLLKHDQYYSNPNQQQQLQPQPQQQSDDYIMPMDLTKPKEMMYQTCLTQMSEPVTLTNSFVSMNERVRVLSNGLPASVDESILLHKYLTARALQDSKLKQCQMNKTLPVKCEVAPKQNGIKIIPRITVNSVIDLKTSEELNFVYKLQEKEKVPEEIHIFDNRIEENNPASSMDTLAEIAASSVKLDIVNSRSTVEVKSNDSLKQNKVIGNDNAKIVALDYVKMASEEYLRKRTKSDREDVESGSDQEMVVENGKIARKNSIEFPSAAYSRLSEDGRAVCTVCSKTFPKQSQLRLHSNIHYIERKFRCEPCAVSFRTQGHLQKHERSAQHQTKVSMTSTFGVATTLNPRPFKCLDCKVAFRIHGHLAKHLRSKSHVMKLECAGKLPFGTYAEIERAGISLTDIDTTDCENSLQSLLVLAQKLHEKDPSKFGNWTPEAYQGSMMDSRESDSDDGEPIVDDCNIGGLNENSSNGINTDSMFELNSQLVKRKIDADFLMADQDKRLKTSSGDT